MFSQKSNLYNFKPAALSSAIINTYIAKEQIQEDARNIAKYTDVARSMEDLAIIATDVEELTPEQEALIKINANVAVAGTSKDAGVYVKDNISTESLKSSSNEEIIKQSEEFLSLWEKLITQASNIIENNNSVKSELESINKKLISNKDNEAEVSLVIPKILLTGKTTPSVNLPNVIKEEIGNLELHLKDNSVAVFNNVKNIVNSGLKEFGSKSLMVAKEELDNSNIIISTNQEGTNIDVDLMGNYEASVDNKDNLELKKILPKINEPIEFSINSASNADLIELSNKAIELIEMSNVVINSFIESNGSVGVEFFKNSLKDLLGSNWVLTNMVLNYCDLFGKVVTSVNTELGYCTYITRYALAVTEILDQVANTTVITKEQTNE